MAATIQNTTPSKYYKTKGSATVYRQGDNKAYGNEQEFFADSGYKNWDEANPNIQQVQGNVYKRPGDATVYEYNPYTGSSSGFTSGDQFTGAGYDWGQIQETTADPSSLYGKKYWDNQGYNATGEQTAAYQPILDTYQQKLDSLIAPVTDSYRAISDQQAGRVNIQDEYKRLSDQYGLGETENLLKSIRQQMLGTQGLMESLPNDVAQTTADFQVTDAGRNLQIGAKGNALSQQLSQQSRAMDSAQSGYDLSVGAIDRYLAMLREQEGRNLDPLNTNLDSATFGYNQRAPAEQLAANSMLSGAGADVSRRQNLQDYTMQQADAQKATLADQAYQEALRQRVREEGFTDLERQLQLEKKYARPTGGSSSVQSSPAAQYNAIEAYKQYIANPPSTATYGPLKSGYVPAKDAVVTPKQSTSSFVNSLLGGLNSKDQQALIDYINSVNESTGKDYQLMTRANGMNEEIWAVNKSNPNDTFLVPTN